jgi:ABC-2 type transport system ATP-binding protein
MDLVGLADRVNDKVKTYSGGMKRRLNLAAALLHDPQILLLDEPTVGVDPQSRNAIFENLETLKQRGKTLVYTTHYMEEAERLCDRIIIIDHGKLIANDTLQGLYRLIPASNVLVVELDQQTNGISLDELRALSEVRTVEQHGTTLRIGVADLAAHAPRVLQWLVDHSFAYRHVVSERANLETVFLTLTGRSLRDA